MKTNITHAAIILADVPYNEQNPRQSMGKHYYIVVCNNKAALHSPIVQAIPTSSNTNRHLPVQVEVQATCFSRRTYALADQLTLLPREILARGLFCGLLGEESMERVKRAIQIQLALD